MIEELEAAVRWIRLLPLAIPLFLIVGWWMGHLTADGLRLPDGVPARVALASHTPRAQLETLSVYMHSLRDRGASTEEYVRLYNDHVRPVETSLVNWGVLPDVARRVAWPLVEHSYARGLDPATVVAVVLVESSGRPESTSNVGAKGLMQVMPIHLGHWDCGRDLYDIEANLCYGTHILAWNIDRFRGDERRALLAYNGCVNGSNTPGCHNYPSKVRRIRDRVRTEWRSMAPQSYESSATRPASPAAAGP